MPFCHHLALNYFRAQNNTRALSPLSLSQGNLFKLNFYQTTASAALIYRQPPSSLLMRNAKWSPCWIRICPYPLSFSISSSIYVLLDCILWHLIKNFHTHTKNEENGNDFCEIRNRRSSSVLFPLFTLIPAAFTEFSNHDEIPNKGLHFHFYLKTPHLVPLRYKFYRSRTSVS